MSAKRASLFTKLFRRTPTAVRHPKPKRTRLDVQLLEDRLMPAALLPALDLLPTAPAAGGARVAALAAGATSSASPTASRGLSAPIQAKYAALGGAGGFLGLQVGDETNAPRGGRVAAFQGGRIYWSAATGAHEVHGAIRVKYDATASLTDAYGKRVLDILGLPTSDELPAANGGRVSHFQGGDIYALTGTGVFAVYGAIKDKYNATASLTDAYGKRVLDILGLPTSDELPTANNGRVSHFQGGDVYANLGVGAYAVYGAIRVKYNALGGPGGKAGLPTSDELAVPRGRVSRFQGMDIYALPGVGVFEVNGAIRAKYNALGGASSFLGLPITDEVAVAGGWYNHFQNGSIFANHATGEVHEVHGLIRDRWASLNWQAGLLGFPTSDEFTGVNGWEVSTFENGNIYWHSGAGAANGVHLGFDHKQLIGAIKKSEADGVLDGGEFNFFHAVASDPQILVPDPDRNLLHKFIDGDRANATSRVGVDPTFGFFSVGNLSGGAPAWKVDTLEKKWFEGLDRPYTGDTDGKTVYAYAKVEGDLFRKTGPDVQDMDQGAVGDCYFIAALGAVALKQPAVIRNMFTDNKDGTFTVRFYEDGKPDYVTVDRYLPVTAKGRLVYEGNDRRATLNDARHPESQPIWVILAEKAFAQLNQSGRIGRDGTNSYNGILGSNDGGLNGGFSSGALGYITGWSARSDYQPDDRLELKTSVQRDLRLGRTVVVSITKDSNLPVLTGNHEYVVVGADANGVTVANPWGHDNKGGFFMTYLSWGQFMSNFDLEDSI